MHDGIAICIHLEAIPCKLDGRSIAGGEDNGVEIGLALICKDGSMLGESSKSRICVDPAGLHSFNKFVPQNDAVPDLRIGKWMIGETDRAMVRPHFDQYRSEQLKEPVVLVDRPEYFEHNWRCDRRHDIHPVRNGHSNK